MVKEEKERGEEGMGIFESDDEFFILYLSF